MSAIANRVPAKRKHARTAGAQLWPLLPGNTSTPRKLAKMSMPKARLRGEHFSTKSRDFWVSSWAFRLLVLSGVKLSLPASCGHRLWFANCYQKYCEMSMHQRFSNAGQQAAWPGQKKVLSMAPATPEGLILWLPAANHFPPAANQLARAR